MWARLSMVLLLFFSLTACSDSGAPTSIDEEPDANNRFGCNEEFANGFVRVVIPTVISNEPGDCEVYVNTRIIVSAQLTVEPGVVIKFGINGSLRVEGGGVLEVKGTASAPVQLKGAQPVAGYWAGISTLQSRVLMSHVHISDAGQPNGTVSRRGEAGLSTVITEVELQNVTVTNSAHYGMYLDSGTEITSFENNTFEGNEHYGLAVIAEQVHKLDQASDYKGIQLPNQTEGVLVVDFGTGVTAKSNNPIWHPLNTHYVARTINVEDAILTLEPGVEIRFDSPLSSLFVHDNGGGLKLKGTEAKPVVLRGNLAEAGAWKGILLFSDLEQLNEIDHVQLLHGGGEGDAAITLIGASLNISNTRIADSQTWAISCTVPSQLTVGDNVSFSGNAGGNIQSECSE